MNICAYLIVWPVLATDTVSRANQIDQALCAACINTVPLTISFSSFRIVVHSGSLSNNYNVKNYRWINITSTLFENYQLLVVPTILTKFPFLMKHGCVLDTWNTLLGSYVSNTVCRGSVTFFDTFYHISTLFITFRHFQVVASQAVIHQMGGFAIVDNCMVDLPTSMSSSIKTC